MSFRFVGLKDQFGQVIPEYFNAIPEDARPHLVQDITGIVALNEMNEVQAIVCLESWSKNSCKIHVSIMNPFVLKHGLQEEVFDFVFNRSGRGVIIGSTPSDNKQALKFNKHMGFVEVARIKDGFEVGVDYVVTELRKENCRWITHYQESANG